MCPLRLRLSCGIVDIDEGEVRGALTFRVEVRVYHALRFMNTRKIYASSL